MSFEASFLSIQTILVLSHAINIWEQGYYQEIQLRICGGLLSWKKANAKTEGT